MGFEVSDRTCVGLVDPDDHSTVAAKFDAAVPHMETALRLEPNNADFHLVYATLLQRIGRNDDAAVHFEAATRLKPNSVEAHYSYAAFLAGVGKNDEYISELRRGVATQVGLPVRRATACRRAICTRQSERGGDALSRGAACGSEADDRLQQSRQSLSHSGPDLASLGSV